MAYSNTLAVLRQYLSFAVGDLLQGQCGTAAADTTHINAPFLWQPNDYYNNHYYEVYTYAGTNIGVTKRVTDWVLGTFLLTVHSAYSATCDATSYIELHHMFNQDDYRKALNLSIEHLADDYLLETIDVTTTLIAATTEYTLPTGLDYVHKITTERAAAGGLFDESDVIDPRDWWLISPRKLKLHEDYYTINAGKDLRIEGQKRQACMTADADICYLPPDWLVQKAITLLPQEKIQSNSLMETYRRAERYVAAKTPAKSRRADARKVVE